LLARYACYLGMAGGRLPSAHEQRLARQKSPLVILRQINGDTIATTGISRTLDMPVVEPRDTPERIVFSALREHFSRESSSGTVNIRELHIVPIDDSGLDISRQSPPRGERIAGKIERVDLRKTAAVIVLPAAPAKIRSARVRSALAVTKALDEGLAGRAGVLVAHTQPALGRPVQLVVPNTEAAVFLENARRRRVLALVVVPREQRRTGCVHEHAPVTGIRAVLEEKVACDVVARHSRSGHDVLHDEIAARVAHP